MTLRRLLRAIVRFWYVTLVLVIGAGALTAACARDGGNYNTNTVVSFMFPGETSLAPGNGAGDKNVISFAGLIAQQINQGASAQKYASSYAPLYGAGIRQGISVGVPNNGGQWSTSYSKAEIDIQVVGRTEAWVETQQKRLTAEVLRIGAAQQADVKPSQRIIISVVPVTLHVDHVGIGRQSLVTGGGALVLAAAVVGAWVAAMLDRKAPTRPSRRRRPTPVPLTLAKDSPA